MPGTKHHNLFLSGGGKSRGQTKKVPADPQKVGENHFGKAQGLSLPKCGDGASRVSFKGEHLWRRGVAQCVGEGTTCFMSDHSKRCKNQLWGEAVLFTKQLEFGERGRKGGRRVWEKNKQWGRHTAHIGKWLMGEEGDFQHVDFGYIIHEGVHTLSQKRGGK